jgi:hypothetical protein
MATTSSGLSSLTDALHADRPAPDRAEKLGLYGWLIGRWEFETVHDAIDDGSRGPLRGEIHAGWVLEGRAIQDVWILPARDAHVPGATAPGDFYGSTLRVYDPRIDAWHILWSDPLNQLYRRQIGRASGNDILQEGTDEAGAPVRWSFSAITADTFRWRAERSSDEGTTWTLQREYAARRIPRSER